MAMAAWRLNNTKPPERVLFRTVLKFLQRNGLFSQWACILKSPAVVTACRASEAQREDRVDDNK